MARRIILWLLASLFLIPAAYPQSCSVGSGVQCTPSFNLWLLPQNYPNWGPLLNLNWGIVDAALHNAGSLNGNNTWGGINTFSQTIYANGSLYLGGTEGGGALYQGNQ
jgi:hypothetical protein